MAPLFEIKEIDRKCYQQDIEGFLPEKIIDVHTHIWLDQFMPKVSHDPKRAVSWPALVAKDNPIEDLIQTYRLLLPGKQVTPLIFGNVLSRDVDEVSSNGYVSESAKKHQFPSLIFALPWWSAEEFEKKVLTGGFLGSKVYLTLSDPAIAEKDIQIFDFLPHHQLEVLNKHGWIAMLHIPRPGRLKDPLNLAQMIEIEEKYPNVKLIIAHVGRAYCPEDVGNAFDVLGRTKKMMFDISANTSAENFEKLIRSVGPRRILFGSDLPITRMRMRRICENGRYVNLVPHGIYGDVSNDKNMREVYDLEAQKLTFFFYEEILAFRRAAEAVGLSSKDINDVFYNNTYRLIYEVKNG
jgi:predicted TIM-barrel fold metal-dependent hydrolase